MVWKEVVEHICDRGSTLKLLLESRQTDLSCGFPLLQFSLAQQSAKICRKSCFFKCYHCPADEVIAALSLTEKQRQEV